MVYSAVDGQLLDELNAVKEIIHRYNGSKGIRVMNGRNRSPVETTCGSAAV